MTGVSMRALLLATALGAELSIALATGPLHEGPCLTDPGREGDLLFHVRELVSEERTLPLAHETRLGDSLPLMPPSQVTVVADVAVCRRAIEAVNAAHDVPDPAAAPYVTTQVLVLRAGSVYVVADPDRKAGEWIPAYVFDRKFTRLLHVFLY